jgi:hypothetical protein
VATSEPVVLHTGEREAVAVTARCARLLHGLLGGTRVEALAVSGCILIVNRQQSDAG